MSMWGCLHKRPRSVRKPFKIRHLGKGMSDEYWGLPRFAPYNCEPAQAKVLQYHWVLTFQKTVLGLICYPQKSVKCIVMKYCADCVVVKSSLVALRTPKSQTSDVQLYSTQLIGEFDRFSELRLSSPLSGCQLRYTVFIRFPTYKSQQRNKWVRQTTAEAVFCVHWFALDQSPIIAHYGTNEREI